METIRISVHHFVTTITVLLTLTALILASLAISGHIDYRDNSIEATAINNHSSLFSEHVTGVTPSAVIDAVLEDGELGAQIELNAPVAGDNTLSLGGVAVTASAEDINRLSGVNKHGKGFHIGGSGIIMEDADGFNYVILDSPANVTTNYTLTFPSSLAAGYLKADAAGTITFADASENPKLHNVQNGDATTAITLTNDAAMTFGTTANKLQLKAATDVELNADSGIIKLIDNTNTFGALTNTSNELVIKSGTGSTTAMTFSGADVTHHGDVTIFKDSDNAEMIISSHHDTEATTPLITLRKSDGTAAAPTSVDNNDVLGTLAFSGYDGTGYHVGAKIEARVNGSPSNGTDMPTELTFWTTPDAAGAPLERLVIDQDGSVNITGTEKFKLAGTAVTSTAAELNLLDGSVAGTVVANKAVIHDGSGHIITNHLKISDNGNIGSMSVPGAISISAGGVVSLSATTVSTSSTTGALTVAGGVGIAGILSAGSTSTLTGDATFGGHIVAGADEAKNIFAAVTSNTITVGGTGSTVAVDKLNVTGTATLTGTGNVNRSAKTTGRYYLEEYFNQLPGMEAPVLLSQLTSPETSVTSNNKYTIVTTHSGSGSHDIAAGQFKEFTFINSLITANSIVVIQVLDNHSDTAADEGAFFRVNDVQAGSCEIRICNQSSVDSADTYKIAVLIDPQIPSNLNFCIADSAGASATTSASDSSVSWDSDRAAINLITSGSDDDSVVLLPRTNTSQEMGANTNSPSAWSGILWGTENQTEWECAISVADANHVCFWAGLKDSKTPVITTDPNQIYFVFDSDDSVAGTLSNNTKLHFVCSIDGTDHISQLPITVAENTIYHLKIKINNSRQASIFVNDIQYNVTTGTTATGDSVTTGTTVSGALKNDTDFKPYVGLQSTTAAADTLCVYYQAINRVLYE